MKKLTITALLTAGLALSTTSFADVSASSDAAGTVPVKHELNSTNLTATNFGLDLSQYSSVDLGHVSHFSNVQGSYSVSVTTANNFKLSNGMAGEQTVTYRLDLSDGNTDSFCNPLIDCHTYTYDITGSADIAWRELHVELSLLTTLDETALADDYEDTITVTMSGN